MKKYIWMIILSMGLINILEAGKVSHKDIELHSGKHITFGNILAKEVYFGGYKTAKCKFAISLDGSYFYLKEINSKCTQITNSKGVKIICNSNKKVCKTRNEIKAFIKSENRTTDKLLTPVEPQEDTRFERKQHTVIDNKLNLMWQDNSDVETLKLNWNDAKSYCTDLTLNGYKDWRLPHIRTLQSIINVYRYKPAIKGKFLYVKSAEYWSSSLYLSDIKYIWDVSFKNGIVDYDNKSNLYYVRCVRDYETNSKSKNNKEKIKQNNDLKTSIKSNKINHFTKNIQVITRKEANKYLMRGSHYYRKSNCKVCHGGVYNIKVNRTQLANELLKNKKTFQDIHPKIRDNIWMSTERLEKFKKSKDYVPKYARVRSLYLGMYLANFGYGFGNSDFYGAGEGTAFEEMNIDLPIVQPFIHEIEKSLLKKKSEKVKKAMKQSIKRDSHINKTYKKVISNSSLIAIVSYTVKKEKVILDVNIENFKITDTKGGLSISFPQLKNANKIIQKNKYRYDTLNTYASGSKLWSGKYHKTIRSKYLLVEGWSKRWKKNKPYKVTLQIDTQGMSELVINVRALLLKNKKEIVLPYNGVEDQQGYKCNQIKINLKTFENKADSEIQSVIEMKKNIDMARTKNNKSPVELIKI